MKKQSLFWVAATVIGSTAMALSQDQPQTPQQFDKSGAGVQSTKSDKLPVMSLPDAALDGGASLTGAIDQAAIFEDRWSAQRGVTYLRPNAIAPAPQTTGARSQRFEVARRKLVRFSY